MPLTRWVTRAGQLNRWCPVQEDVEDYFRQTLENRIMVIDGKLTS